MMKYIFGIFIILGLLIFGWLYNLYDEIKHDIDIVVNCLVDYYYTYNPKANKDVLWKMVGKYIVENIKENTESKSVLFPFPTDTTSDIKYMGYDYELREVEM